MDAACRLVSDITREGILPAALEILDELTIQAVEGGEGCGYPRDAAAVLLIELDGFDAGMDEDESRIRALAKARGVIEFRVARDEGERQKLWAGRKGAFGAMGRINTDLYILDGVVPRARLADTLQKFYAIAARYHVTLANVLHAGDGNLHPNLSYDGRDAGETARVLAAGREILQVCVDAGGTVSGEHGIGIEKAEFLPMLFDDDDLALQTELRDALDTTGLSNPHKVFPDSRSCVELGPARAATERLP